jgi:hypothetical protein
MMTIGVAAMVLVLAGPSMTAPYLCSVREMKGGPRYERTTDRIGAIVDQASVIVRAEAVSADSMPVVRGDSVRWFKAVRFAVREVVRDSVPGGQLVLPGWIVDRDDFNRWPVPYQMVRASGQRGDCYASEYRLGAEYLLLLARDARGLNVRWMPLAPLNEQIRDPEDPWLRWVRERAADRSVPPGA